MARKPMTWSEQLVGRRLPPEPSYRDQILAGFIKEDGEQCGRMNPGDRWLMPAFTKIRNEGLVRMGLAMSFGGRRGKLDGIWYLRDGEKPLAEARAAKERVREARDARQQWSRDFHEAYRAKRQAGQDKDKGVEPSSTDDLPNL